MEVEFLINIRYTMLVTDTEWIIWHSKLAKMADYHEKTSIYRFPQSLGAMIVRPDSAILPRKAIETIPSVPISLPQPLCSQSVRTGFTGRILEPVRSSSPAQTSGSLERSRNNVILEGAPKAIVHLTSPRARIASPPRAFVDCPRHSEANSPGSFSYSEALFDSLASPSTSSSAFLVSLNGPRTPLTHKVVTRGSNGWGSPLPSAYISPSFYCSPGPRNPLSMLSPGDFKNFSLRELKHKHDLPSNSSMAPSGYSTLDIRSEHLHYQQLGKSRNKVRTGPIPQASQSELPIFDWTAELPLLSPFF
jgi:hypothetical protein